MLPVHNSQDTLHYAITSIQNQTLKDWELLILDDGSIDDSYSIACEFANRDMRIRVVRGGVRRGLAYRLNEGVTLASADLLARMDHDDIAFPQRLAVQVQYLSERPDVDLVGTGMISFADGGYALGFEHAPPDHAAICRMAHVFVPLYHPTWLGRLEWFRRNPYNHRAVDCEDQELLARTAGSSRFANIPTPLLGYRRKCSRRRFTFRRRATFIRCIAPELLRTGQLGTVAFSIAAHAWLGARDITFGRGRVAVDPADRERWLRVWSEVSAAAASPRPRGADDDENADAASPAS